MHGIEYICIDLTLKGFGWLLCQPGAPWQPWPTLTLPVNSRRIAQLWAQFQNHTFLNCHWSFGWVLVCLCTFVHNVFIITANKTALIYRCHLKITAYYFNVAWLWLCSFTSTWRRLCGAPAGEDRKIDKSRSPLFDLSRFHYNLMTSCFLNCHFKRLKENVILKKSIDVCYVKVWVDGEITSPSAKVLATVLRGHIFIFIFRDALLFAALPLLPVCRQSFSLLVNADSPNPIFLLLSPRLSGRHLQFGWRPTTSIFHFSPSCQVFCWSSPLHWRHCAIPCLVMLWAQ